MIELNRQEQNQSNTLTELGSVGVDGLSATRRTIKAVRKWQDEGRVMQFIATHPITAKVYFATEFLTLIDLGCNIKKIRETKSVLKIVAVAGKILGGVAATAALLPVSPVPPAALDAISFVGSLLGASSIVYKGQKGLGAEEKGRKMLCFLSVLSGLLDLVCTVSYIFPVFLPATPLLVGAIGVIKVSKFVFKNCKMPGSYLEATNAVTSGCSQLFAAITNLKIARACF